jgi:KUP system potassium uptake protein
VAELTPGEVVPQEDPLPAEGPSGRSDLGGPALALGALGVVYGDIGTSPLYAMETVFSVDGGAVRATVGDVLGVASLIFGR